MDHVPSPPPPLEDAAAPTGRSRPPWSSVYAALGPAAVSLALALGAIAMGPIAMGLVAMGLVAMGPIAMGPGEGLSRSARTRPTPAVHGPSR